MNRPRQPALVPKTTSRALRRGVSRLGAALSLATVLGWSSAPSAAPAEALQEDAPGEKPSEYANDCVQHTTSVRYVMGYDHLVHLESHCSRPALCEVRTDVSPEVVEAAVRPGGKETVVTFRGSPARVFEATVDCRFAQD